MSPCHVTGKKERGAHAVIGGKEPGRHQNKSRGNRRRKEGEEAPSPPEKTLTNRIQKENDVESK